MGFTRSSEGRVSFWKIPLASHGMKGKLCQVDEAPHVKCCAFQESVSFFQMTYPVAELERISSRSLNKTQNQF